MEVQRIARHVKMSRFQYNNKFNLIVTCCQFSTSSVLNKKKPWDRNRGFKSREAFESNLKIKPYRKELFLAQKSRRPSDYPLGDDQKVEWKHSRWYDKFYNKWVTTLPSVKAHTFNLNYKEKRLIIHEQDTLRNRLHLLLGIDNRRKYVIKPLNMDFPRNASYYYQHLTNTKFVHGMPHRLNTIPIHDNIMESFETFLTNYLQMEFYYNSKTACEKSRKKRADRILSGIVHHLIDIATPSNIDLLDCELDYNPENSMYWQRGRGFHKYTMPEDYPVIFQSHDSPFCQIRTKHGLTEFTPWMEDFMLTGDIPFSEMTPHVYDIERKSYRNLITPGIRYQNGDTEMNYQEALEEEKLMELPPPLSDPCLYGHTQFISLPEEFDRQWYKSNLDHCDITDQLEEHLKAHGIMSGWTWSAAQAHFLGHWMDKDIEKPISVQTVITDGQYISFFCYQLNTIAIDPENADSNPRRNVCYGTPMMKLYNRVEGTDDIELYQDPVKLLLKFIFNGSHIELDEQDTIAYNSTLEIQEWDKEKPTIEEQKPKHIRERELELAMIEEQEKEKEPKRLRDKLYKMIMD